MTGRPAVRPLPRSMKVVGALFLTLSAATPASSVFVIVPDVIAQAGTGAVWAMAIAAMIAVVMAQVYAELGSAFPIAGGEYAMVGRVVRPLAGVVVLALNLVNSVLTAAVLALGVSDYLGAVAPGLAPVPTALTVVTGATLLSVLNIRTNALVTGLFVAVELLALMVLAGLGVIHPERGLFDLAAHPVVAAGAGLSPTPLPAIGLAVAVAIFAYDGYGAAIYFGEEMHAAARRISHAILGALVITVVAEAGPLLAVLVGAPDLKSLLPAPNAFSQFVAERGGKGLSAAMGLGVGLAIINAVIATILLIGRQVYSTGRDATWPGAASRVLAAVHPRWGSPWAGTLLGGALAAGLCLVRLKLLLIVTGTGMALIYASLCLTVILGRTNGTTAHAPFRMRGFPWAPALGLVALAGVLWTDLTDADGRIGLMASAVVAGAAALYYLAVLRRRGWALTGPEPS